MRSKIIIAALLAALLVCGPARSQDETCCGDNAACEQLLNEAMDNAREMDSAIAGCQEQLKNCQATPDEQLNPINQLLNNMAWYAKMPKAAKMGVSGLILLGLAVGTAYIQVQ